MKVGESIYCDGVRLAEVIYVSGFSMRDSKNPRFASADKASQFSIILNRGIPRIDELDSHLWAVSDGNVTSAVKIIACHYDEVRTMMVVEVLPAHFDAHP